MCTRGKGGVGERREFGLTRHGMKRKRTSDNIPLPPLTLWTSKPSSTRLDSIGLTHSGFSIGIGVELFVASCRVQSADGHEKRAISPSLMVQIRDGCSPRGRYDVELSPNCRGGGKEFLKGTMDVMTTS
jgi:hypothetical protein